MIINPSISSIAQMLKTTFSEFTQILLTQGRMSLRGLLTEANTCFLVVFFKLVAIDISDEVRRGNVM